MSPGYTMGTCKCMSSGQCTGEGGGKMEVDRMAGIGEEELDTFSLFPPLLS